jgi:hypothetical protein
MNKALCNLWTHVCSRGQNPATSLRGPGTCGCWGPWCMRGREQRRMCKRRKLIGDLVCCASSVYLGFFVIGFLYELWRILILRQISYKSIEHIKLLWNSYGMVCYIEVLKNFWHDVQRHGKIVWVYLSPDSCVFLCTIKQSFFAVLLCFYSIWFKGATLQSRVLKILCLKEGQGKASPMKKELRDYLYPNMNFFLDNG